MLVKIDIEEVNKLFSELVKRRTSVYLDEIPELFHEDLIRFMYGQTMSKIDGRFVIYYSDFMKWMYYKYR